jgi:hypothetical protein
MRLPRHTRALQPALLRPTRERPAMRLARETRLSHRRRKEGMR